MHIDALPEEDLEYRRALLRAAANGDVHAQKELEQEFHARAYSHTFVVVFYRIESAPNGDKLVAMVEGSVNQIDLADLPGQWQGPVLDLSVWGMNSFKGRVNYYPTLSGRHGALSPVVKFGTSTWDLRFINCRSSAPYS